jgi:predicted TIM-barrel fold metal-dependent hydrolase
MPELIDLHAHNLMPEMFNQHPHWGPFWDIDELGDNHIRVGKWVLSLSTPERRAAIARGEKVLTSAEELELRAEPANRLAQMDDWGIDVVVVSLPSHCYMYHAELDFAVPYARRVNDANAKYCAGAPDRLYFWAHLPMQDPAAAVTELGRAVGELGAKGAGLGGANFGGREFDDEDFDPLWEKICELDVPIFVHGYNQSVAWGDTADTERYETTSIVGMCYDESRCFWNLVCGGVLDRFPELQVYITHGGGYVPYQLGRFDQTNRVLGDAKNTNGVREYLPNFWFDPLVHERPMRRAVVEVIGADRLVYGDNFGGSDGIREDLTEGIGLSETDRVKIRSGNAKKLLKL